MWWALILSAAIGYLLGSIPVGLIVGRATRGIDVREYGSQHPQWVDIAEPGRPSIYVTEFPGVGEVRSTQGVNH